MKAHNDCTGCFACQTICNQNAIEMAVDEEGFSFPRINELLCKKCGLCTHICDKVDVLQCARKIYCVQYKNKEFLSNATSGGIIAALSESIIKLGGAVIGVKYDCANEGASWVAVEDMCQLPSIQGSKYFQIPLTKSVYELVKNKLKDKRVLFIGTPCQVAAMVKVAGCDNLITVDLVCGGVASPLLEKKYIDYISRCTGEKVRRHDFRKKVFGWSQNYCARIELQNGAESCYKGYEDLFNYAYNSGNLMRESCYNCQFTRKERVGDFTVGDAWGIKPESIKEFDIHEGASLVLVNSSKAEVLMDTLGSLFIHSSDEKLLKANKPLNVRMRRRIMRNVSYSILRKLPFKPAVYIINYRHTLKKLVKGE